jgi:hypothetical protein
LGRRAVWFFSLDVHRTAIAAIARSVFALSYCWARATHERHGERHRYQMRRGTRSEAAVADLAFTVGAALEDDEITDLDHFLSARWALVTRPTPPTAASEDPGCSRAGGDRAGVRGASLGSPAGMSG